MTHSFELRAFVAAWESLRLKSYDDGGGVWTIGYGRTKGVRRGDTCIREEAEAWLDEELADVSSDVTRLVVIPIEQHQHDALVSLTYNIGAGAFAKSTLLQRVNAGLHEAAVCELLRWAKDGGKFVRGLLARRAGEGLMYSRGSYDAV